MSASWVAVRIADQIIVGHYRSRREAAEKAFQFSQREPHVALRQFGPGWPGDALWHSVGEKVATAQHNPASAAATRI
jgi:hypothetical protein